MFLILFSAFFVNPTFEVKKVSTVELEIKSYMKHGSKVLDYLLFIIPGGEFTARAKRVLLHNVLLNHLLKIIHLETF